jgi:hypothetical protein
MPNNRLVLAARVEALRQDLTLAHAALRNPAIRLHFRESVGVLFGGFIDRKTGDLDELARDLGAHTSDDRGSLADYWRRFEQHTEECDRILKEYRAFIEGALVRSAGLDDGICDLADAFLRQLARLTTIEWTRFTIVAEGESFAPMTDIIRLRYPHFSIWNLPVLAHEFGHFVTPRLQDRLRGTDPLGTFRSDVRRELSGLLPPGTGKERVEQVVLHLDEFMADAFALHTAGPSFASACIHLRFEPMHAYEDLREHPSDGRRVYLQLKLLGALGPEYVKVRDKLSSMWQDNLAGAGATAMPGSDPWLDRIAARLGKLFQTLAPKAKLETDNWRTAVALSQRLLLPTWQDEAEWLTPRDILNGAWLCRLDRGEVDAPLISSRALELGRRSTHASSTGRAGDS